MIAMHFDITKKQIIEQTKTVTRRLGWENLKVGDLIQPIAYIAPRNGGHTSKHLGCPIRVTDVYEEHLCEITEAELIAEGFPHYSNAQFVAMFCAALDCDATEIVRRIAFEYTEPPAQLPLEGLE